MSEINEKKEPLNKNNKVPKIRFKEFATSLWEERTLGSLSDDISYGLGAPSKKYDGCNKYLRITDIDETYNNFIYDDLTSPDCSLNDYYSLQKDDLLFARTGASTGKTYLYSNDDGKVYFAGFLIRFRLKMINSKYVYYQTKTAKYNNWVSIYSKRSGQPGINANEYSKLKIGVCCIEEQNKIACFLSALDGKIQTIDKKISVLKKYKKGLAREAIKDTIFYWKNGAGNATALSNYLTEINEYSEKDGTYPHVTLSTEGISNKSERYDRDFLVKDDNKKYKVTHINQLCYNPANLKFGVICINRFGDGIFSPIYVTFKVKNIYLEYLELIVTSADFNRYSMKYQQGTVYERMAVSSEDLCKIKIVIADEQKQNNLALTANLLNKKISKLESELNDLMLIKSNLLNNMFI